MNIAQITLIYLDGAGSHPCLAVHGFRKRNYYFFRPSDSAKFQRVYSDTATGEGVFPLSDAQEEITDILAGRQGAFDVKLRTVEEVTAEREAIEAERKRDEEIREAQAKRMAEAERQLADLQKQQDEIRAKAAAKEVEIATGIAQAVHTEAEKEAAPKDEPPSPAPAPVKRKKSPIPSAEPKE